MRSADKNNNSTTTDSNNKMDISHNNGEDLTSDSGGCQSKNAASVAMEYREEPAENKQHAEFDVNSNQRLAMELDNRGLLLDGLCREVLGRNEKYLISISEDLQPKIIHLLDEQPVELFHNKCQLAALIRKLVLSMPNLIDENLEQTIFSIIKQLMESGDIQALSVIIDLLARAPNEFTVKFVKSIDQIKSFMHKFLELTFLSSLITLNVSDFLQKLSTDSDMRGLLMAMRAVDILRKTLATQLQESRMASNSRNLNFIPHIISNTIETLLNLIRDDAHICQMIVEHGNMMSLICQCMGLIYGPQVNCLAIEFLIFVAQEGMILITQQDLLSGIWFTLTTLIVENEDLATQERASYLLILCLERWNEFHKVAAESSSFLSKTSLKIKQFTDELKMHTHNKENAQYHVNLVRIMALISSKYELCRSIIIQELDLLVSLLSLLDSAQMYIPEISNSNYTPSLSESFDSKAIAENSLMCILSFTRSVRQIRTKLFDFQAVQHIQKYLKCESKTLKKHTLRIIANMVMVFSPFRDDFTGKETLKQIISSIDRDCIDECCEVSMLVFMNLAYWSSKEFSELLIEVMDAEKVLNCFTECLNYCQHNESDPTRIHKMNFLRNFVGFLRNTIFERFDCDLLFFKHQHLYMTAIGSMLELDRDGKSTAELKESVFFLMLNCSTGKNSKTVLISNQLVLDKLFKSLKEKDEFLILLSMSIIKELIGYGFHGFKERISVLKGRNLVSEMKRLSNWKSCQISEVSKCILELIT